MTFMMYTTSAILPDPAQRMADDMMGAYGLAAVEVLEHGGRSALRDYAKNLERSTKMHTFLFDEQGTELSGQSPGPDAKELLPLALESGKAEAKRIGAHYWIAKPISDTNGVRYVLVGSLQHGFLRPPPMPGDGGPSPPIGLFTMRLATLAIVIGIVCYWLARYVTAPVRKLRSATQQLAEGDLAVRVGNTVRNRRDEIGDLGRDFDFMAERIETLVAAQRRLLRDISHELRSPLARLNVALGIANRHAGPEASSALERIEREAERLNELIGRLMTLNWVESGAGETRKTTVDLADLVRDIAADADFEASSRNRHVRITDCEPCTTTGAPELLRSAIENVARNAVHYTAEETEVEIGLGHGSGDGGRQAVIRIRDHGPGVPAAALAAIFRPFHRVADARERQTGGTGLGLAITERIVRLHGGTVCATNASDGGLVVEIRLPAGPNAQASSRSTPFA